MNNSGKQLILAEHRGMCGGVRRAIQLLEEATENAGSMPVCVLHEIVHNNFIISQFEQKGVRMINSAEEIPEGACAVFSAHGVSRQVENAVRARAAKVTDATCPLVKKLHQAAADADREGQLILLLGHLHHPEVDGILGQLPPGRIHLMQTPDDPDLPEAKPGQKVRFLTQTTLDTAWIEQAQERLRRHYGDALQMESGICYATRDRQDAVRKLAKRSDLVIVAGSPRSSNSNRLREVAAEITPAVLIDTPEEIETLDLQNVQIIGLTAGASVPDELTDRIRRALHQRGYFEG